MSKIESDEAFVTFMSGRDILNASDELEKDKDDFLTIVNSCGVRAMGLGRNVGKERKKFRKFYKDRDFLLLYTVGEAYKRKSEPLVYLNESMAKIGFNNG